MESDKIKETDALRERFPYWIVPDVETLLDAGDTLSDEQTARLRRRIAALMGDEDALRRIVGDAEREKIFDDFYPDAHVATPSTDSTIDAFLDKFGHGPQSRSDEADDLELQRMLGTPSAYALTLEQEEQPVAPQPESEKAVAPAPLKKSEKTPAAKSDDKKQQKEAPEGNLTESLAFVMIKNGNYAKALEIITQLSLKNPEKSIYFADQIRFLRKLVSISGLAQGSSGTATL